MSVRSVSREVQEALGKTTGEALLGVRISGVIRDGAGFKTRSVVGPSREAVTHYLDRRECAEKYSLDWEEARRIHRSSAYENLFGEVHLRGIRDEPAVTKITAEEFMDLWFRYGEEFTNALFEEGRVYLNDDESYSLLYSDWRLEEPISLEEIAMVRDALLDNDVWLSQPLSQLVFAMQRNRVLWVANDPSYALERHQDWSRSTDMWSKYVPHDEALAWALMSFNSGIDIQSGKLIPPPQVLAEFAIDDVLPYVESGIRNPGVIVNALRHDVEPNLAVSLTGSAW
jgi:hypothetical protein